MPGSSTDDVEQRIEQHEQRLLELLAQRAAAPAGKRGGDWDALAAVIASFIGLLALAVSGYTAYVQREQLRAQVLPRLTLYYNNVDSSMGYFITNQGAGPATVFAMRVLVDGKPTTGWRDVWDAVGYARGDGFVTSTISHGVISPGKDIGYARPGDDDQSRAKFKELMLRGKHQIAVTLCYCSILDDCWIVSNDVRLDDRSTTRDDCPITRDDRFVE